MLREARSWGLRRAGGSQPDCAVFQTPSWLIFLSACLLPTSPVTFPIRLQIKPFWPQEVSNLTDCWHFAVIVLPLFLSYCNFLGNSFSWLFSEANKQSFCAQQFPQICELKHDTLTNDTVLEIQEAGWWGDTDTEKSSCFHVLHPFSTIPTLCTLFLVSLQHTVKSISLTFFFFSPVNTNCTFYSMTVKMWQLGNYLNVPEAIVQCCAV